MLRAFVCVFLLATSVGIPPNVNALRKSLENRYRNAKTLKAAFFEQYSDRRGGIVAESGTVYFSRPGRMRWEYQSPTDKLFLVDGTNAWFYVPADHTASRAKMKESSDWRTPLALLAGKADLSELCQRLDLVDARAGGRETPLTPGDALLRCIPRDHSSANSAGGVTPPYVLLEADPQARLVRVIIQQPGDVETEFRFGNWEENIVIPEAKFHFAPPPGVAIVDEESLANEIH
ncbi:MAG TPA: outer membrane lipoprotein carrier protein LolA [Candidatus Acidoferrales bacterium]|nr:outer membrane lipoprotein carrier protein LolA [Candidatus Acidoferrales bacterium]